MDIEESFVKLDGLVVFRNLLDDDVVAPLGDAMFHLAKGDDYLAALEATAEFERRLFARTTCWTDYLLEAVLEDENAYVTGYAAMGNTGNAVMEKAVESELAFLESLGTATLDDLLGGVDDEEVPELFENLPRWEVREADFAAEYADRMSHISTRGYGMFASHRMFTVEDGALVPVKHPDPQTLDDLPGYEREREKIIENTEALLEGRPANNILLYGDAGTGKSSAVKAIANEYADRGLRLVEIKKSQLFELPEVLETLSSNPLKFIIFIDDLSFTTNDRDFAALKAILEGSVFGRNSNIVVYATSNRRHLVKETLEDRSGTDIHENDTRQELMSLSARFGLVITFMQPDRERYAHIVLELARKAGIEEDEDSLIMRAERFAIRSGGRSPRAAKQFIDLVQAGVEV